MREEAGEKILLKNPRLFIVNSLLTFKTPAGTSRGIYRSRKVWYIWLTSSDYPGRWGVGECAPLPDLSCDAVSDYEERLFNICRYIEETGEFNTEDLRQYPSILFGLETTFRHFKKESFALWDTPFSQGRKGIQINGLIWMGNYESMFLQIEAKIKTGFRCVKLKIGAIHFEKEVELLKYIRKHFSSQEITLRVDANGAFSPIDAFEKLSCLAELDIHSIEQPIRAGQWLEMKKLTKNSPLPIALDEELIGITNKAEKIKLLTTIHPQYIILKPSLHGGFSGCQEWIDIAKELQINWWITSALESNIGLNAIAQWTATLSNPLPQGLGTGQLFLDNIDLPLKIEKDNLWFGKSPHNEAIKQKESSFNNELYLFISEWLNDTPYIQAKTSGSTGDSKTITIQKEQMRNSARITCNFFNLKKDYTALLCMPLDFIAGKMMVVRALELGMRLIARTPSSHPLKDKDELIDFAAMTPMQVYNSLHNETERSRLKEIKVLLIGGGVIPQELERELHNFPNRIYSTYGMTETCSHIALRQLNGEGVSVYYSPFSSIKLSLSEDDTLCIDAPLLSDELVVTNDIAELLPDGRFRIVGRKDNIINSGGIKIQTEAVEETLRKVINSPFAITSVPHPEYGEAVTLLIEGTKIPDTLAITINLPKYQHPIYIWNVDKIPLTETGKIARETCKKIALNRIMSYNS